MKKAISWDGALPRRRYAIFTSILHGNYSIVVKGNDIETAEKWGGFVQWLGPARLAETRKIN